MLTIYHPITVIGVRQDSSSFSYPFNNFNPFHVDPGIEIRTLRINKKDPRLLKGLKHPGIKKE
jgi:hypothetical protein